jgi:hypothetical protein
MPSITTWTRVEPRPRAPEIASTLAARIRDPLWMLTRQWQFGEFGGEDAGSIAFARLTASRSRLTGWRSYGDGPWHDLTAAEPLEDHVASEPFAPDLATRVELGQRFEAFLARHLAPTTSASDVIAAVRRAYPLPPLPDDDPGPPLFEIGAGFHTRLDRARDVTPALVRAFASGGVALSKQTAVAVLTPGRAWLLVDPEYERHYRVVRRPNGTDLAIYLAPLSGLAVDHDSLAFHRACVGRCSDGVAIYNAARARLPLLPSSAASGGTEALRAAADDLKRWVVGLYGGLGTGDPAAWVPERLEYGMTIAAVTPAGETAVLTADPGRDGDFDWHAFDLESSEPEAGLVEAIRSSAIPGRVVFPGMPTARWWEFEPAGTSFDIKPDKRDLGKLVFIDFMHAQGNDWFVLEVDQPVGTLCRIDTLVVRDVFGVETLVERADATSGRGRWTMFSTSAPGGPADFLIVPPTAVGVAQTGPTIEEVRFLRDEMANMVWAVEHSTENSLGEPRSGHERALARRSRDGAAPASLGAQNAVPLRYVLQTEVPEHWIPFVPVASGARPGDVMLERQVVGGTGVVPVDEETPLGRILRPSRVEGGPYRVFEEEVPREGARVLRVVIRSRWVDGSTHLWITRRRTVGSGEGSSGLTFDQAVPVGPR